MKLDIQGQGGGRILDADGQWGGDHENWTIFMDVICVSFLIISIYSSISIETEYVTHFTEYKTITLY